MNREEFLNDFADHELRRGLAPSTVKRRRREVERFLDAAGKNVEAVTRDDMEAYLAGLRTERAYNDALRAVRQFYGFLVREELLLADPSAGIDLRPLTAQGYLGVFTTDEIHKLLAACAGDTLSNLRDRAIMTLLYATGIRLGELAGLTVYDVDFRRLELLVRHGKGGKERRVPLGEAAASVLEEYLERRLRLRTRDKETLFLNTYRKPFRTMGILKMITRRKDQAGIASPGLAHAFRHSCASHMLAEGAPLPAIQKMLGHAHLYTTARYTHVMKETLAKVHAAAHPRAKEAE